MDHLSEPWKELDLKDINYQTYSEVNSVHQTCNPLYQQKVGMSDTQDLQYCIESGCYTIRFIDVGYFLSYCCREQ